MKITDVTLIYAKHYLFVHIHTDEGIIGLGEAGNWGYLDATAAAIRKFSSYLIGKDPFQIEDIGQNFYRSRHLGDRHCFMGYQRKGPGRSGLSAPWRKDQG